MWWLCLWSLEKTINRRLNKLYYNILLEIESIRRVDASGVFFFNPKTIAYLILFWKEELFPFF